MGDMTTDEKARRIEAISHRLFQVAELQKRYEELEALRSGPRQPLDFAAQLAQLSSKLRIARLALAQTLHSLPAVERTHFIKMHAPKARLPGVSRGSVSQQTTMRGSA